MLSFSNILSRFHERYDSLHNIFATTFVTNLSILFYEYSEVQMSIKLTETSTGCKKKSNINNRKAKKNIRSCV